MNDQHERLSNLSNIAWVTLLEDLESYHKPSLIDKLKRYECWFKSHTIRQDGLINVLFDTTTMERIEVTLHPDTLSFLKD